MKSSQILKALQFHPQTKSTFGGVFARNKVPTIPKGKCISFVVNTDPSSKPGEHWVAFFITPSEVYYFDPYGIPPTGFKRIINSRGKQYYFGQRLQGLGRMCGHYCLYFILCMRSYYTFNIFGSDFNANDRIVKQFVENHFPYI